MESVFGSEPCSHQAYGRNPNSFKGAIGERLAYLRGKQQSDLPPHMAGNGVSRGADGFRSIGGRTQMGTHVFGTFRLSENCAEM
jgi:hypothetical protein